MTGIIIGILVTGTLSIIVYRTWTSYGMRYDADPNFRRNYLLVGAVGSIVAGIVVGALMNLIARFIHH